MAKLTESQRRVLRMIERYKMHVSVRTWDDGYQQAMWVTSDPSWPRSTRCPNVRTMRALERKGLLKREAETFSTFRFVLTPEGHAIAEGLRDAENK